MDPGRDVGTSSLGGGGVLADEPGDVVVRHPGRTMIPHGVEHRGRRFRAGVEHSGVAAEVLGRLAGDGQAPGFGALPEQVHGEPPGVDVGDVHGEHLGVAGSQVIHENHEELITQPGPGARVRDGEQRRDRVSAHVLHRRRGWSLEPRDGGEVGKVDRERRLGGRRVGEERPDVRQPLVAGRGRPRLRGPHVVEEPGDGGPVDHREGDLLDTGVVMFSDVAQEHVPGLAARRDRVPGCAALAGQERGEPLAKVPVEAVRSLRAGRHGVTAGMMPAPRVRPVAARRSGSRCTYHAVEEYFWCPM